MVFHSAKTSEFRFLVRCTVPDPLKFSALVAQLGKGTRWKFWVPPPRSRHRLGRADFGWVEVVSCVLRPRTVDSSWSENFGLLSIDEFSELSLKFHRFSELSLKFRRFSMVLNFFDGFGWISEPLTILRRLFLGCIVGSDLKTYLLLKVQAWMVISKQVAVGNRRRVLENGADKMNWSDEEDEDMKPDEEKGMYTAGMDPEKALSFLRRPKSRHKKLRLRPRRSFPLVCCLPCQPGVLTMTIQRARKWFGPSHSRSLDQTRTGSTLMR
jgi:hypothetical protein